MIPSFIFPTPEPFEPIDLGADPNCYSLILPADKQLVKWNETWPAGLYGVAPRPFDHVLGNLYIGGIIDDISMFRYVFCCTHDKTYRGTSNAIIHIAAFYDIEERLPPEWLIDDVVGRVLECCSKGPTYVHCTAGLNRSALIVALALVKLGWEPETAVAHLRTARCENVLSNPTFLKRVLHAKLYQNRPKS